MKDEGLESYFSKVLRIKYRINPKQLRIVDLISCMSRLFGLEEGFYLRQFFSEIKIVLVSD